MAKLFTFKKDKVFVRILNYCDLETVDYKVTWELQKNVLSKRINDEISDTIFLLEHNNTYTLGRIADKDNLISSEKFLTDNNISVYEIDRGGDVTYHGPGQIVGYPIISLKNWEMDTHKYLRTLEEVIIKTCSFYDIDAGRNPKYTGVWVGNRKIAAIGIKIKRWVTMHGFAFNVNTDLSLFNGIIPCGIIGKEVTSLKKELNKNIEIQKVKLKLLENFVRVFGYENVNTIPKKEYLQKIVI